MDLRILGIHPDPEKLSPKRLAHMHGLAMASHRRLVAIDANATRMACSAGFNGDKERHFAKFINRMMARPVFRSLETKPAESVNVTDRESAAKAAQAKVMKLMAIENQGAENE